MKILLVHNSYQQSGGEDVVFDQERKLLQGAGHEIATYTRSNWEIDDYHGVHKLDLIPNMIWSSRAQIECRELLQRHKPDLVHVHNTFLMISPSIYSTFREARVPVVRTLHNYRMLCPAATFYRDGKVCEECVDHSLLRSVIHGCYHDSRPASALVSTMLAVNRWRGNLEGEADCFIALTNFARSKFIDFGVPSEKIFVKPNFMSSGPAEVKGNRGGAIFVGRLTPEKGLKTLLKAWSLLQDPVSLTIVGSGPQMGEVQELVHQLKLSDVCLAGRLPRHETLKEISKARFLIFPSEWYECFPMTIVEAFAAATPVICSRLGSLEEIVRDGHTGVHFEVGDPRDLAAKIKWAMAHPAALEEIGAAGRREFEARYTAETNYSLLMEIYSRALHSETHRFISAEASR